MSTEKKSFPTPRTDAQRENPHNVALESSMSEYRGKPTVDEVVPATLSEELEQECAMLKQQTEHLAKALEMAYEDLFHWANSSRGKSISQIAGDINKSVESYRSTKGSTP